MSKCDVNTAGVRKLVGNILPLEAAGATQDEINWLAQRLEVTETDAVYLLIICSFENGVRAGTKASPVYADLLAKALEAYQNERA